MLPLNSVVTFNRHYHQEKRGDFLAFWQEGPSAGQYTR
jgi:hypothetical protein